MASRLLEYELRVRANARGMGQVVPPVLARVALVELAPTVLERALQPFATPVRTLDALHLSTALYLRAHGQDVEFAAYDRRMIEAAEGLGLRIWPSSRFD